MSGSQLGGRSAGGGQGGATSWSHGGGGSIRSARAGPASAARPNTTKAAETTRQSNDRELRGGTASLFDGREGFSRYCGRVSGPQLPGGVVHELPGDLREALLTNPTALDAWKDITPLARNEFICWVEDAKQDMARQRRIRRTQEELEEGQRRPCCWPGCKHRERNGR